jgi:hypothetical protein
MAAHPYETEVGARGEASRPFPGPSVHVLELWTDAKADGSKPPMTPEVHQLCLILAHAGFHAIPAFVFVTPYRLRRRWTEHGDIVLEDVSAQLPKWPMKLFDEVTHAIGVSLRDRS